MKMKTKTKTKKISEKTKWQHWKNLLKRLKWVKEKERSGNWNHFFNMNHFIGVYGVDPVLTNPFNSLKIKIKNLEKSLETNKKNPPCKSAGCLYGECFIEFFPDKDKILDFLKYTHAEDWHLTEEAQSELIKFVTNYLGLSDRSRPDNNYHSEAMYVYQGQWSPQSCFLGSITIDDAIAYVEKVIKEKRVRVRI